MNEQVSIVDHRHPDYPILDLIWQRWSPRAMSGEPVTEDELMRLFEAARWAPSCFNEQPWKFVFARRDSEHWSRLYGLMVEFNRAWNANVGALVVAISRRNFARNDQPNRTHSFDAGAAWQNIALQGSAMGLVVHGMAGFDYDRAREALKVPQDHQVEMMFSVGRPGNPAALPDEIRAKEVPSDRQPVARFVFEGALPEG